MLVESIFDSLKHHCRNSSGDEQIWIGNNGTYYWSRGKTATDGTVNGVVRKLAGQNETGEKIWVVAGSLKISSDGTIQRFTGLSKKTQSILQAVSKISIPQNVKLTEEV